MEMWCSEKNIQVSTNHWIQRTKEPQRSHEDKKHIVKIKGLNEEVKAMNEDILLNKLNIKG